MNQLLQTSPAALGAASFGSSADGMLVGLVGENAYAMVPAGDGKTLFGQRLAHGQADGGMDPCRLPWPWR